MLVPMLRSMGQARLIQRARRLDPPGRLMAFGALVGAGAVAVGLVLLVTGSPWALPVAGGGAVLQVGGFLGALWWALRRPAPGRGRARPGRS